MNVVDDDEDADVRELLRAARGGDERALGCLLAPHWCGLKVFCGLMLGEPDAADRAMAQTVLTAQAEVESIDSPAGIRMWIHRIAVRESWPITIEAAVPLYVSLISDTGGFRHANTNAEALSVAAELIRAHGGEIHLVEGTIGATFRIVIPDRPVELLSIRNERATA